MISQIVNQQTEYPVAEAEPWLTCALEAAARQRPFLRRLSKQDIRPQLTILFVDPQQMQALNRQHRQVDENTDVLSFPMLQMRRGRLLQPLTAADFEPAPGGGRHLFLGDIVLQPDKAAAQAHQLGQSTARELAFLLVHGLLHLLGYDHQTPGDEAAMLRCQRAIMAEVDSRAKSLCCKDPGSGCACSQTGSTP